MANFNLDLDNRVLYMRGNMSIVRINSNGYTILKSRTSNPDLDEHYFCRKGEFSPESDIAFEKKHLPSLVKMTRRGLKPYFWYR